MSVLIIFIQKAIVQGICILYGALGEIMTEKSGNLNLGIPGIMYMGGISGLMGAFLYEKDNPNPNALIGVLISFLCAFACAAIGENPGTADAAGINVIKYKYLSTCIGAGLAGLGGLYFVMEYSGGTWTDNGFGDRGWLAVALVIFALWKPLNAIWGAFLFGALYILYLYIPGLGRSMQEVFKALPYVVTIIVLVFTSFRKKKEHQPPAALGLPYFREER